MNMIGRVTRAIVEVDDRAGTFEEMARAAIAAMLDNMPREAMARAIGHAHNIEPDDPNGMMKTSDFLNYANAAIAAAREAMLPGDAI